MLRYKHSANSCTGKHILRCLVRKAVKIKIFTEFCKVFCTVLVALFELSNVLEISY